MGAGKTQGAIALMNNDRNGRYLFITPYLDEVERIKRDCTHSTFYSPENTGGGKLDSLHKLLELERNVASTHALFSIYTPYTASLIESGGYTLILDEVFCVVEHMKMKKSDMDVLLKSNLIEVDEDGERVRWIDDDYDGTRFADIKEKAKSHTLILFNGMLLFWTFPVEIFKAFKRVIILTYMFGAQLQKYYFDMYGIEVKQIGTKFNGTGYKLCDSSESLQKIPSLKNRITILEDARLNAIGDSPFSLSVGWYKREVKKKDAPLIEKLKNNVYNYFTNKCASKSNEVLWTTFKEFMNKVKGKGYTSGFLSYNIRATNEFRDRKYLAYCVNVFLNPVYKQYFYAHGFEIDEDNFALSEMVQWIWRSAIRDGKEICVYVPSKRMRELLLAWIEEVS